MYGRFTRALASCTAAALVVAACSSRGEHAAVDSAKASAPAAADSTASATPAAPAPAASAEDQIKAAEDAWRIALVSGDTVALSKLTGPTYTQPKPGHPALTETRKDLMSDIGGGMVQSDTSAISGLSVKTNGDTAVAKLQFFWRPSRMGKPAKAETQTVEDTWVRKGGDWQLVARRAGGSTK